jgi:hypothetical protein
MWSGAPTDVRLPDGKYLWAPYFLDAVRAEWLDKDYRFTEKYFSAMDRKKRQGNTLSSSPEESA